ncbi:MAG: formylglycine-generating enzyme family protein [Phaeodactylibacter sp.]|uniref:formylglycine-generating enzyme family protein n=1 Tax=Phaeodactylibacter sp. TaxID=1940289 RepID=UPI0032EF3116
MKYTLSILVLMLPLLLSGQKSAMEDYFKGYLAALNNLGDVSYVMEERSLFRADILDNYFLRGQGSVLYNHFRPGGTTYVPASEYLDIIITDFPRGVSFSYEGLEVADFQLGDQGTKAIVDLSWSITASGRSARQVKHRFVLEVIGLSSGRVSARIKSLDKVPEASSLPSQEEKPNAPAIAERPPKTVAALPAPIQALERNMVQVSGGSFTMGCTLPTLILAEQGSDCWGDESPAHRVELSSFSIGKYEVTQGQWEAVMGSNPSRFSGCFSCPVEKVSWEDVQKFIQKLNRMTGGNYRLPTEAEWEYAARGGSHSRGYKYSGSGNLGSVGWYTENSRGKTHPVGQKSPNELGLYDMNGNVYEWCLDWYNHNYYSSSPGRNPKGTASGFSRVRRGGDWSTGAKGCRVSNRSHSTPGSRSSFSGFRLAAAP